MENIDIDVAMVIVLVLATLVGTLGYLALISILIDRILNRK